MSSHTGRHETQWEVLFKTHPHSSTGISFVRLRVRGRFRLGDVVCGSDADAPLGNNHAGIVVGGGCRVSCRPEPRGKGIDTSIFNYLYLV
jgi:hypothetical protein